MDKNEARIPKPERRIRFTDSDRNALFDIPDGGSIVIARPDGGEETVSCRYVDENSFEGDGYPIRIGEFAQMMEESGNLYGPEGGDAPDAYEIARVQDGCCQKIYAGVLASNVTPEDILRRHNESRRPCGPKLPPLFVEGRHFDAEPSGTATVIPRDPRRSRGMFSG